MSAPLVDTHVISELARREPDPGVERWAAGLTVLALSVVTLEEIAYGLAWRPNRRIRDWFERFLDDHCEVLAVTAEIARHAGELRGRERGRGRPRTQADMLIAATALVHDRVVVTRNRRDFEGCGLALLDPFG